MKTYVKNIFTATLCVLCLISALGLASCGDFGSTDRNDGWNNTGMDAGAGDVNTNDGNADGGTGSYDNGRNGNMDNDRNGNAGGNRDNDITGTGVADRKTGTVTGTGDVTNSVYDGTARAAQENFGVNSTTAGGAVNPNYY